MTRPGGWRRIAVIGLAAGLTILAVGPASAATETFSGSIDANGTSWRATRSR